MKKIIIVLLIGILGMTILMVSISRAGLEIMIREDGEGKLRSEPVMINDKIIYRLPEVGILPSNPLYGLKVIREQLWERFSFGGIRKSKVVLLMADKKMAETKKLIKDNDTKRAFKSGTEAVNKLKYARGLVLETQDFNTEKEQLINQIKGATLAYQEIVKGINNPQLQQNIDDFKKEQEKEGLVF